MGEAYDAAADLLAWLAALEIGWMLGVPEARRHLEEAGQSLPEPLASQTDESPRLSALMKVLSDVEGGKVGTRPFFPFCHTQPSSLAAAFHQHHQIFLVGPPSF